MNGEPGNDNTQGVSSAPRTQRPATHTRARSTASKSSSHSSFFVAGIEGARNVLHRVVEMAQHTWAAPRVRLWRARVTAWSKLPYTPAIASLAGTALISLLIALINYIAQPLPSVGIIYLPLIALLGYQWAWRYGALASALQLACVYLLFMPPAFALKPLTSSTVERLVTLLLVDALILALAQLARTRRELAEREAQRFAALNTIGVALAGELDEQRLLRLIAQTALDLTGAGFAAFTVRPVDALGHQVGPSDGVRFHLAAVVGVTPEQEAMFRRMSLGGEGLLAPIFRYGVSVRAADALQHVAPTASTMLASSAASEGPREAARHRAAAFAQGQLSADALSGVGVPQGHPMVRSFLGAPLLDREGQVRGGLLLGHSQPNRFTPDDTAVLEALAAQASVAIENARLYRAAQTQARELDAVFESIAEGVYVVDAQGQALHENSAAAAIHSLSSVADDLTGATRGAGPGTGLSVTQSDAQVNEAITQALKGLPVRNLAITRPDSSGEWREYLVSASPLHPEYAVGAQADSGAQAPDEADQADTSESSPTNGAVVVWHDVTEARQLLAARQARAHAETQRTLLQAVIDELPSGAYLVRGREAQLILANRAAMDVWGASWRVGETMLDFLATSGTQMLGVGGHPLALDELATLRAVRTGEAVRHHQEVILRPDGTLLPVLLNAVALDPLILSELAPDSGTTATGKRAEQSAGADAESAEYAALVVLQDVTALKEAERLKDEFIAVAAHELKTPMAAIKGYADMLLRQSTRDGQSRLADWQTEALETIDQAASRLVELTNDLLDVTKIQADRMELHPEPHDLVALARRVIRRFQVTTVQHTLSVEAHGAPGDQGDDSDDSDNYVVACLDVPRTEQVLSNLLSNAIKYSPEGGAVLINVRMDVSHGEAALSVQDHGIGIPEAQQARLFNRFERADNARERGIAGTGLGLYLCRELVERQGGRIWFTSADGQGTTISMTLPLATE